MGKFRKNSLVSVILLFSLTSVPSAYSASQAITGVQLFPGLPATHVTGKVTYSQTPPAGGKHSATWLNCGIYSKPVPNENAVHSLEHSAVWVTYDPKKISGTSLLELRKMIPNTYAILSPYPGISTPVVLSAWGAQLKLTKFADPRFNSFLKIYRLSPSSPEPGAPCTGGLDAAGKVK